LADVSEALTASIIRTMSKLRAGAENIYETPVYFHQGTRGNSLEDKHLHTARLFRQQTSTVHGSSKVSSRLDDQEIPSILWNPGVYHRVRHRDVI
jgi:hypothetical protein